MRDNYFTNEILCVFLIFIFMIVLPITAFSRSDNTCSETCTIVEVEDSFEIKRTCIEFRPQDFVEVCVGYIHINSLILKKDAERITREILKNKKICTSYLDISTGRYEPIALSRDLQIYTIECCERYSVPFDVIMGIFGVETGWNVDYGISPNGKYCGIAMIHIEYNRDKILSEIGADILDPKGNIEAACYILSQKIRRFDGDITKAVIAYNRGDAGATLLFESGETQTSYSKFVFRISDNLIKE